jgi:hypothetical protein
MTAPATSLDLRYSDPDAAATGWDETRRVLEEAQVFWISTVRSDGRPHVTPVCRCVACGILYFDTGITQQKAINLRSNPRVVLTTGCVHRVRAARAGRLPVRAEHDVVDDQLAALAEQVSQGGRPLRAVKYVGLADPDHGQHAPLRVQGSAPAGLGLLLGEQRPPGLQPSLA